MLAARVVYVDDDVLRPMFTFLHYSNLGCFHLNKLLNPKVDPSNVDTVSRKRKRIVQRMARGYSGLKKRRFS